MKLGYLVNQYPKVSHTFIRREIFALEKLGFKIERYALRGWDAEVVDPADLAERGLTHFLLQGGVAGLLLPSLALLLRAPLRSVRALAVGLRHWRSGDRSLFLNLITFAEACLLTRWLARDQVAHLHVHFGTNATVIALMVKALGGPGYSFTLHGAEEWDGPRQLRLGDKIAGARFVAAISSYTRGQLSRWSSAQEHQKLAVVRCGIERALYDQQGSTVPENQRFVCVGRICIDKAQLALISALGKVVAKGYDASLVLAGDGELRAEVESLVRRLKLESRVRITGWITGAQVRQELLASRAMVLPSLAEGLPVVIMEAMASRRPVLSTYIAGIPELVEPGKTGWLFPSGSVDAIVTAMIDCLNTPISQLDEMGEAARRKVWERHCIETEAAKLAELFRKSPA